jgi:hypothetical protein
MHMITVKPSDGQRVRNPEHRNMPLMAAGEWVTVQWSQYWQQLIDEGVVVAKPE